MATDFSRRSFYTLGEERERCAQWGVQSRPPTASGWDGSRPSVGKRQFPSGSLEYCFVTTVQYKQCCFTTTRTEVCYEYVSPVRPTPALRYQRRCAGCVSLLRQPKPETLPGAQRRRVVDDHQVPELPVLGPARALVETRFHSAAH